MRLPPLPRLLLIFSLALLGSAGRIQAQSMDKKAPAPVHSGTNSASVDSLIGPHYWYFFVESGPFQVSFSQGSAEGLGASGHAAFHCGFSPETPGAQITVKSSPQGDVFSGSVKQRTRVGIAVFPPNSPLVRSTVSYSINASGAGVVFDTAKDQGPAIAGMYNTGFGNPLGAVRFNANGTIEASNGSTGTWKLFDESSATYTVVIAGKRMSLRLDPGRGLIDIQTTTIPFTKAH